MAVEKPDYSALSQAVCFGPLKHAALYFDKVLPINPVELFDYDDSEFLRKLKRFPKFQGMLLLEQYLGDRLRRGFQKHDALIVEPAGVDDAQSASVQFLDSLYIANLRLTHTTRVTMFGG